MPEANVSLSQAIAAHESRKTPKQEQELSPAVTELQKRLDELETQNKILQQQLEQKKQAEENEALLIRQRQADEEAAKLEEEADLKNVLKTFEADKYDTLTNKEIIDVMAQTVDTALTARQKQLNQVLENRIGDLASEISKTQKAIMNVATTIDIRDVKSKHEDFDNYQKEAAIIMQDTPGISVERAYLLAKAEAAAKVPPKKELDREKPDTTVTRSAADRTAEVEERRERQRTSASERKVGIAGVRDIIDAGIEKILSQRGETE